MLTEVQMRLKIKEENGDTVEGYRPALVNAEHIKVVMPSGIEGVLILHMLGESTHMVKGDPSMFLKKGKK